MAHEPGKTWKWQKWDPVKEQFDDTGAIQYRDGSRRKPFELSEKM